MAIHASASARSAALRSHGTLGSILAGGVRSHVTTGGGVGSVDGLVELGLHAVRATALSSNSSRLRQVDGVDRRAGVIAAYLNCGERYVQVRLHGLAGVCRIALLLVGHRPRLMAGARIGGGYRIGAGGVARRVAEVVAEPKRKCDGQHPSRN